MSLLAMCMPIAMCEVCCGGLTKICRYLSAFVLLETDQYGGATATLGNAAEQQSSLLNFSVELFWFGEKYHPPPDLGL